MPRRSAEDTWAETNLELVRAAFLHVFTRPAWLRSWKPVLTADKVRASLYRRPGQIQSPWFESIGDLPRDPSLVAVLTEHAGYVSDPYLDRDSMREWEAAMRELRRGSWVEDASWDSVNPGLHVIRVVPRIVG